MPLPAQAPDVQEQSDTAPAVPLPMASAADVPAPAAAETVAASRPLGALPAPVQQAMATLPTLVAAPTLLLLRRHRWPAARWWASRCCSLWRVNSRGCKCAIRRAPPWSSSACCDRANPPEVPGQPPWAVVIDDASATEVRVRGHVFDTNSATKVECGAL